MEHEFRLSRIARRRRELLSLPPAFRWRILGSLPILALALLLVVNGSFAWFTSGATTGGAVASGQWSTLMAQNVESITQTAYAGTPYSKTILLTSSAVVDLPLLYDWTNAAGASPAVQFKDANGTPVSSIPAGGNVTVYLTGNTASFTGTLNIYIGSARFDTHPFSVQVTVKTDPIDTVITPQPTSQTCTYKTGTSSNKITWLDTINFTSVSSSPFHVTITQSSSGPVAPVWVAASGSTPPDPPAAGDQVTTATFTAPTHIYLYQGLNTNDIVTWVDIAFTSTDPNVTGTYHQTVAVGHADDIVKLGNVCKTAITYP